MPRPTDSQIIHNSQLTKGCEDQQLTERQILIVEDEDELCGLYQDFFTEFDWDLVFARSGVAGVEMLTMLKFDFMIVDWCLPFGGGKSVLSYHHKFHLTTPYMIATGNAREIEENYLGGHYLSGVFHKPFHWNELIEHVYKYVNAHRSPLHS